MLETYLENYIEILFERQNEGASLEQQGSYSRADYHNLLKPVVDLVNKHKDLTLDELRNLLFVSSGIEQKLNDFIHQKQMVPGMVLSYGTDKYRETIIVGNRQEVTVDTFGNLVSSVEEMTEDTIFDLASITKLFTSISILKLVQNGTINLTDEVIRYAPEFKNLKGITIFDLITFGVPLKTKGRVDSANSTEEAEQILFDIEVDLEGLKNNPFANPYTDMGAMILKYVIEHVTGMNYYAFVCENILNKVEMRDTHIVVPEVKIDRLASTNFDGKYYRDGNFSITKNQVGAVYDPKAQMMGQLNGILSGHAGLFSTAQDMTSLAKGIINDKILDNEFVEMMAKNRTGKKYTQDGKDKYVQYLGMLCYSKHPILSSSELYHAMSGKALASAGWTGTQLTVDPINQLYFFMAGNRSHNRMTFIDSAQRDKVQADENGKKMVVLPNGTTMIDATRFAWDRDEVAVHPALKLCIQYKFLEDIYTLMNEKIENNEIVRKI